MINVQQPIVSWLTVKTHTPTSKYGLFLLIKRHPKAQGGAKTNRQASQSVSCVHQRLLLGKVTKVTGRMWVETGGTVHPFHCSSSISNYNSINNNNSSRPPRRWSGAPHSFSCSPMCVELFFAFCVPHHMFKILRSSKSLNLSCV